MRRFRSEDLDHLERLLTAERHPPAPGLHGRREQHDRQRARPRRLRPSLPGARSAALRRRRPRLRGDRRARAPRAVAYGAGKQHRPPRRETYDNIVLVGGFSKAYSSLLAFIALPDRGQEPAEGRRPAVPVLGAVARRVAGHRARRDGRKRDPGRRDPRATLRGDRSGSRRASRGSASPRRTDRASRSSRSRCATRGHRRRRARSCSIAAST